MSTGFRAQLLRRLGTRDAALIVMGGIIGSGIFMTPSTVARLAHTSRLIMLAWIAGGIVALLGAFLFAELAARRPNDGGFYSYLRDAFHPVLAFAYGWTLLLVSQSGGSAAAAVTFATYFAPLTGINADVRLLAALAIAAFTVVNLLGVRAGASTQNAFMALKIVAIVGLIALGIFVAGLHPVSATPLPPATSLIAVLGLALAPVLFSYSGWQTSSFMTAELKEPQRTLPRGLLYGVLTVVALYLAVNIVCLHALGAGGLAMTQAPASAIARAAMGPVGARIMAGIIVLSTLGFLGNQILTSPRIYFQMAADGVFFKSLAWVDPRTHVPAIAITLQGAVAIVIALSGRYGQILDYVISVDYVFFGFAAIALFIFRARDAADPAAASVRPLMPGHPWTTALFLVVAWAFVTDLVIHSPQDSLIGLGILLSAIPVYVLFARRGARAAR